MSLTIPNFSKHGLYIRARSGDIDEDPDFTDMWYSFLPEQDDDEDDGNQYQQQPFENRGYTHLLKEIHLPQSNFESFMGENTHQQAIKEHTTQDKMLQIQNGTFITNALKGRQNLNKGATELAKGVKDTIMLSFRKNEDGTLEMVNQDFIKRQKQVFTLIMKQFGTAIFSGKSLTTISLPVIIFGPWSALEKEALGYGMAPHFLEKAGTTRDVLEQFKLTVAYHISSLHLFLGIGKPFNPILGETFQAIVGGNPIYVEQISHHPPISAVQMVGKNYTTNSVTEVTVHISMGLFKLCRVGLQKVNFKNTGTTVKAQLPPWCGHGGLGRKTVQFANKLYVFDVKNKLYAEIVFDYEEGTLFKKPKHTQDHFSGNIWRVNDKFAETLSQLPKKAHDLDEIKFKEKEHAVDHISTIEGYWLEYLKIGDKTYWTIDGQLPHKMQYFDNPLPSDANFRMDVLYFREKNETKAQELKEKLEELQRKDRKLRQKTKPHK